LSVCCNLDCEGHAAGTKKRCGKCRKWFKYTCAVCGTPVDTNKRMYCHDCAWLSNRNWAKEYQRRIDPITQKKYSSKWLDKHPGYMRKYMKEYWRTHYRK